MMLAPGPLPVPSLSAAAPKSMQFCPPVPPATVQVSEARRLLLDFLTRLPSAVSSADTAPLSASTVTRPTLMVTVAPLLI